MIHRTHQARPSNRNLIILVCIAFLVRLSAFYFYVQHNERYCQPDSMDYHISALGISSGIGMFRPDSKQPIFWRTPGYPAFLAPFYYFFGQPSFQFSAHSYAQKMAIFAQIVLCSFLPLLLFFLALALTSSLAIAWASAWIGVFHIGFVLASTYLLTDGLAQLFFVGFLVCLFKSMLMQERSWILYCSMAGLLLAGYTWMRPMGQFIAIIVLFLYACLKTSVKDRFLACMLFALLFFGSIAPWYIRNHTLTDNWFFCPLLGPYLTLFSAPKIRARVEQIPLEKSHQLLGYLGGVEAREAIVQAYNAGSSKIVCTELTSIKAALPWIIAYPGYFLYDWLVQVMKTMFDLYSCQLTSMSANTHKTDPLIEYLGEKTFACMYKQPMPTFARFICWFEFVFTLFLWIGLLAGAWMFIIRPLAINSTSPVPTLDHEKRSMLYLWLTAGLIIAGTMGMTGGFGYARLRLPIEPLLIILSLTFWRAHALNHASTLTARKQRGALLLNQN